MILVNHDEKHEQILNELDLGDIDPDKQFLIRQIIEWMKETDQLSRYSTLELCNSCKVVYDDEQEPTVEFS